MPRASPRPGRSRRGTGSGDQGPTRARRARLQDGLAVRRVQHVNLTIPKGAEPTARAFYTGVMGLREIEKPPELRVNGGLWYAVGDFELHLSVDGGEVGKEGPVGPSRRHVGFVVDDLEQARQFFQAQGVATLPQADLPGWQRFYVHDPFGNRLEIQCPRRTTRG